MTPATSTYRSRFARAVFDLLNPIPYGLFVGTLIFDITYAATGNVFWGKGAAWLVTTGLFFAIIPRLINLCHVWLFSRNLVMRVEEIKEVQRRGNAFEKDLLTKKAKKIQVIREAENKLLPVEKNSFVVFIQGSALQNKIRKV